MKLRPGQKLHSAVCDAQVVVVKAPPARSRSAAGAHPLLDDGQEADGAAALDPSLGEAPCSASATPTTSSGLELLCTRAGTGALTVDGRPLLIKGAKPLPSSD